MKLELYRTKNLAMEKERLPQSIQMASVTARGVFNPESDREREEFKVLQFGGMYEGTIWNHETQGGFNCVGFLIETQHIFEDFMADPERGVGFYPIWTSPARKRFDPILFYNGQQEFALD